jgi:hypothetical protein
MKLTIDQLSKLTKLPIPTLRVYVSRHKLGIKVGNRRVFSQADVQKLLKSPKKSPPKNKLKPAVKKTSKRAKKPKPITASVAKPKAVSPIQNTVAANPMKPSFWSRLFGGRKEKEKISLMDAKTTK